MKMSALKEHTECQDQRVAVNLTQNQTTMASHVAKVKDKDNETLCSQLKMMFHIAKSETSGQQDRGMIELLKAVKAPDFLTHDRTVTQSMTWKYHWSMIS